MDYVFAPTQVTEEKGMRTPAGRERVVMVDAALHAMDEILKKYPEAIFYGQDVGRRLGGVFREAATLAEKYGDDRVFNTPIQEAYIVGSTAGLSAVGLKPIVEIQFADYSGQESTSLSPSSQSHAISPWEIPCSIINTNTHWSLWWRRSLSFRLS
jgi:2-oxoisovalerate dehydrogenase E1 component